ncbi:MAG: glycosyltransferase family 2 protein [Bacteroidetes bacterium]|nr:MAG: glycosyltransferase family 2 protein [Bacteroidota bacterium]
MSIKRDLLVSVIVVCKNESAYIADCIDALINQQLNQIKLEILVVDGESDDGSLEILHKYDKHVTIIKNKNKYTPHGINLGIQAAKGDYIAIVGARSILSGDYIQQCINLLITDSKVWCVGGQIIQKGTDLISNSIANAMSSIIGVGMFNFRTIRNSRKVDTVSCPVIPQQVIKTIGTFDESLIRNQDDDFSYRIIAAGGLIYQLSDTYSIYYVRQHFSHLYRQYFQYGFWKILLNKKHRTLTSLRQIFPALFLLSICVLFLIMPIIAHLEVIIYLLIVSLAALFQSINKPNSFFYIVRSIVTIHLAYGFGYWYGIWEILIKNTVPDELKTLTR